MDRIFEFVGSLLMTICGEEGTLGGAIFLFTAFITLFMLVSIISEIRSLQLADHIRPLHEGIVKKLQNKPDQMGKDLIKLHKAFDYNTFLGISGNLVHIITVFFLAGTFLQAERYLPAFPDGERGLLWIRDMAQSPFSLLLNGSVFPDFLLAAVSVLLMDYLMSVNSRFIIRKSLMPVETLYKCLAWITVLAAFFLPQAILAYFIIYYFFKNLILLIYLRFIPYVLNESQQVIYSEFARKIK